MNIFFVGDIVGRPGREIVAKLLPGFMEQRGVDFCIINAENSAGGSGLTPALADELFAAGAHVLTNGDHVWRKKEIVPYLGKDSRLLRPANFPPDAPGKGTGVYETEKGPVAVINLMGRVFMDPLDCPFRAADRELESLEKRVKVIFIDMHAEATSEKIAMGWHLDGMVSAIAGTHTHVPTADACILPKGTGYITDVGMTGPYDSVIGRDKDNVISALIRRTPAPFTVASKDVRLCGVFVSVNEESGKTESIERIELTDKSS